MRKDELDAKGIGEIGIVGMAAAIGHSAAGKRIRDLPVPPDALIGSAISKEYVHIPQQDLSELC